MRLLTSLFACFSNTCRNTVWCKPVPSSFSIMSPSHGGYVSSEYVHGSCCIACISDSADAFWPRLLPMMLTAEHRA
jgi:hypothetical protein